MSLLKPIVLGAVLAFSSAAFAGHRPAVSIHLPAVSVSLGSSGNLWVSAFVDHHGKHHPGYWRPAHRHGWVWVDGYRDHHGHWHEGYWRKHKH